jgi:hypothetical protein
VMEVLQIQGAFLTPSPTRAAPQIQVVATPLFIF